MASSDPDGRRLRQANDQLQKAEDQLNLQAELMEALMAEPTKPGIVLSDLPWDGIGKRKVLVYVAGETFAVNKEHFEPKSRALYDLRPGQTYLFTRQIAPMQKLDSYEDRSGFEAVCIKANDHYCELDGGGKSVFLRIHPNVNVKPGDRVLIDSSAHMVIRVLPPKQDGTTVKHTGIAWADIGGQDEAKAALMEAIELPFKHADLYAKYGKKGIKGVLLYGPPGCGKTMLGKAAATSIANLAGSADGGFIYVKGPEVLDKFVGESERKIRGLFEQGRQYHKKTGYPAILFIDEAESMMNRRGSGISSDIDRTIVPTFLSEMDGMDGSATIVILATNRVDTIDNAILREGRVDRKVKVTRPSMDVTQTIFSIHMKDTPLGKGMKKATMTKLAAQEMFNEAYQLAIAELSDGDKVHIPLAAAISGAMIASVVDRATTRAIHRELEGSEESGIIKSDVVNSIRDVYKANLDVDHSDIIRDILADRIKDTVSVRKVG